MTSKQTAWLTEALKTNRDGHREATGRLIGRVLGLRADELPEIIRDTPVPPPRLAPASSSCSGGVAQPKPKGRIKSPKAMAQYKAKVGKCETGGDDCQGPLDFSHIKPRGAGGDDTANNGFIQCRYHHELWHQGPLTFIADFNPHISAELRLKFERALGLELGAA